MQLKCGLFYFIPVKLVLNFLIVTILCYVRKCPYSQKIHREVFTDKRYKIKDLSNLKCLGGVGTIERMVK